MRLVSGQSVARNSRAGSPRPKVIYLMNVTGA
jgi:hypothetical protein